jgi:polyphosphate kinase 2 (PPK2 family)
VAKTASMSERLAVGPDATGFQLAAVDPGAAFGLKKKRALKEIEESRPELLDFQTRLYAENRRSLLVVLQGMDTSGKDGTGSGSPFRLLEQLRAVPPVDLVVAGPVSRRR